MSSIETQNNKINDLTSQSEDLNQRLTQHIDKSITYEVFTGFDNL